MILTSLFTTLILLGLSALGTLVIHHIYTHENRPWKAAHHKGGPTHHGSTARRSYGASGHPEAQDHTHTPPESHTRAT